MLKSLQFLVCAVAMGYAGYLTGAGVGPQKTHVDILFFHLETLALCVLLYYIIGILFEAYKDLEKKGEKASVPAVASCGWREILAWTTIQACVAFIVQ